MKTSNIKKGKSSTTTANSNYDMLYVNMSDYKEKRKSLLLALKDSLVIQEEYEKVVELRKNKAAVLAEIKKQMDQLNTDYQEVKKILPNVKNVLSFTEKELTELDRQEEMIKSSINADRLEISNIEEIKRGVKGEPKVEKKPEPVIEEKKPEPLKHKHNHKRPLTKYERIKNNLSVIEEKLKQI